MTNVSPLRYPDEKTSICKILYSILKENINLNEYSYLASPFFGGGSFEFFIGNKFPHLTILANDKFTPLFNFWEKVSDQNQNKRDTFCQELEKELCEVSINWFTESSIDRIKRLNLEKFKFTNIGFIEFMYTIGIIDENKKYFVFLDPPCYIEKSSKLYGNSGDRAEDFDHEGLWALLLSYSSLNIPWMLTYNDCPYIRDLYSLKSTNLEKIKIREVENKKSSVIVITSF